MSHHIYVDAACSGNPGVMEYRAIDGTTNKSIFHRGPYHIGTNNIGEFLAIVDALRYCRNNKLPDVIIYSDSQTAISWIRSGKIKTTLQHNQQTEQLLTQLQEAIVRIKTHRYPNKVVKRDTEKYGEIPADFGRK